MTNTLTKSNNTTINNLLSITTEVKYFQSAELIVGAPRSLLTVSSPVAVLQFRSITSARFPKTRGTSSWTSAT